MSIAFSCGGQRSRDADEMICFVSFACGAAEQHLSCAGIVLEKCEEWWRVWKRKGEYE